MKRILLPILLGAFAVNAFSAEIVEAIVARVGDRIITRSQYSARLREALAEVAQNAPADQVANRQATARRELLNEMLSELLLKDRADRIGLSVSPAEVADALARLKAQYGIKTDEEFNESLVKNGMTRAQMESRLRDTLLTQKVFGRELRSRQEMADRDLREKYEREKERFRRPERAKVREIIVIPADASNPDSISRASARAVQITQRAKEGEDFAKLAQEFSDAPTKSTGGDLGEVAKGEMLAALDDAVFAANAGSVIGPVQTRNGFHILKVEQRLSAELPAFESVKEQLKKDVSEETFQRDYKAYVEKLRKEAFIEMHEENLPKG
jgi:parvulin-like peptidyl-prolyl isomerase